ncbi:unannotated protein [freshwater metagenome]|uniref:Unannotated protein n=1 Tax=freshwater metagenome TaxID=449393 RepID=A0A6J7F2K7_9ZZZZ
MGAGGDAERGTGVGQHVLDAIGRVVGIHRYECRAGFCDGPDRQHRFDRSCDAECHEGLGAYAVAQQNSSESVGPTVQLPVRHFAVGAAQCDSVRVHRGSVGEDLRQQPGRASIGSEHRCQRGELGVTEESQPSQWLLFVLEHGVEDTLDAIDDGVHGIDVEQFRQVLSLQVQAFVDRRDQSQRVVRCIGSENVGDLHTGEIGCRRSAGPVDGVRLEHRQGVESHACTRCALDIGQAEVVVIQQRCLFGLNPIDQCTQRFAPVERDPDGQGVDEQPDHALDTRNLRRTTRHRRTEHDVLASGEGGQHDAPCGLDEGVEGRSTASSEVTQCRGGLDRQRPLGLLRHGGQLPATIVGDQQRGFFHAGHCTDPLRSGDRHVALAHPRQVIPVGRNTRQHRVVGLGDVERDEFLDDQRRRPSVQQDVVVGQQQTPVIVGQGDEREPQQRCPVHLEAHRTVGLENCLEGHLDIGLPPKVDLGPRNSDRTLHDLQ